MATFLGSDEMFVRDLRLICLQLTNPTTPHAAAPTLWHLLPPANLRYRQVSIRNRINVAVDWFKVRFFGRDITRL